MPVLERIVPGGAGRARDAGIVAEDREGPEPGLRGRERGLDGGVVRHIDGEGGRAPAEAGRGGFARFRIAVPDRNCGAVAVEAPRYGKANAPRAARHHGCLVREVVSRRHGLSRLFLVPPSAIA